MKYAVEMGSVAMIYIKGFIKLGAAIQKLLNRRGFTDTQTAWKLHEPFFDISK
jgi:hypothetical protein